MKATSSSIQQSRSIFSGSLTLKMISVSLLAMAVSLNAESRSKNSKAMDSLGSGEKLMERANPTVPANTYRVVQKRVIDREFRHELMVATGAVTGGDSYYATKNVGLRYEFHFSPRWSVGIRHDQNFNELTNEGRRVFDQAEALIRAGRTDFKYPDLDFPVNTQLATISFYPLYGKMSWFESTVSYFDFYFIAGGGRSQLKSGSTQVVTAGGGVGMWWNQWLTTRIELRYQGYEDKIYTGPRKIDSGVGSISMGLML